MKLSTSILLSLFFLVAAIGFSSTLPPPLSNALSYSPSLTSSVSQRNANSAPLAIRGESAHEIGHKIVVGIIVIIVMLVVGVILFFGCKLYCFAHLHGTAFSLAKSFLRRRNG
jgi:hypothetical protein